MRKIRPFLMTAAELSDKSPAYLGEEAQLLDVEELIDKFLNPAEPPPLAKAVAEKITEAESNFNRR